MHQLIRSFVVASAWLGLAISGAYAQGVPLDSRGKEFWLGFMKNTGGAAQLTLKIASPTATTGTVAVPLAGWSISFSVPANGVTSVDVPVLYECSGSESIQDRGVKITSAHPITVTAVNYQTSTTDAMQVFPIKSLGTDYLVDAAFGSPPPFIYRSEFLVVATQDGTVVEITPSVNTAGGHPANVPFTVHLNAGQTYQVQAVNGSTDLTGSRVTGTAENGSCRPFAVFGGSMCAVVSCSACDHVCEQMTPINTWGRSFHTIPVGSVSVWSYRVMARENATNVSIDGGAPIVLNAGQSYQVLNAAQPVWINADKPVSATQLLQGQTCANIGDPSLLALIPDDRASTSVVFTTLTTNLTSFYHLVTVVVPTAAIGQVMLDGVPVASSLFLPYPASPGYSRAKVPLSAGVHALACPMGLLAYAYGYGIGESYLYSLSSSMTNPPIPPGPQDTLICSSTAITLTPPEALVNAVWTAASAPGTILSTANSYTFTPDHNDIYRVDGELSPSGCPRHYEFRVGLPVDTTLHVVANDICQGSSVQLGTTAVLDPSVFNLQWSPADQVSDPTIPAPVAYPTTDTWFALQVTSPVGCGSTRDSALVHVRPSNVRSVRVTADDTQICSGEASHLHAQVEKVLISDAFEGPLASWWNSVQGGLPGSACGSVSGQALYFNGAGTRSATTAVLDLSAGGMARFSLKIANGTAPCDDAEPGEGVVLESSVNGITWSIIGAYNEASYPTFTPITVVLPPGGSSAATTRLRWRQLSNSGAGQDNWSIDNVEVTRYEDPTTGLNWSPAAGLSSTTTATPTATPTSDTWYKATMVMPSGCAYSDSILVHVSPVFSIAAMNDTSICGSNGIQLQARALSGGVPAGPGTTWSWSPAAGLSSANVADPIAHPAQTTGYTVSAVNGIGCTDTEFVQVIVSGLTAVSASTTDPSLCHGEQTTLNATIATTSASSIVWSPSGSVSAPGASTTIATPTDTTTYTVTVTDMPSGCTLSASVTVDVAPPFSLQLSNDTSVCITTGLQLHLAHDVPAPYQIAWSPAAFLDAANVADPTIQVDTTATYVVTVTGPAGCSITDSVHVAVAFDNLVTPIHVDGCEGETLTLDAGFPGSTYIWTTGPQTQTILVDTNGTYTATITDSHLCQAIRSFVVDFTPLPVVDLGPDLALCGVSVHQIDAGNPGNTVHWNTGVSTHQLPITSTGTYDVTVTTPNGCESRDTVSISMDPLPVDALQDLTPCAGAPPVLNAGNAGSTYLWNGGDTTQTITASVNGTYSVTITTPQQCSATYDAVVQFEPLPTVDLGPDTALCGVAFYPLAAGVPGQTVHWSTGAGTQQIAVSTTGTYSVMVSTPNGCTAYDTVHIDMDPLPVDVLQDVTACVDVPPLLDAGNAGSDFLWSSGETSQTVTPAASGTYSVTITTPQQCRATYDALVTLAPLVNVNLGPDTTLCAGSPLVLDAGNSGNTVTWSTGSNATTITPTGTGAIWVRVDNGYCVASDTIMVVFKPLPVDVLQDATACIGEGILFDAGNPGSSYLWNTGSQAGTIHVDTAGTYSVAVTGVNGCMAEFMAVADFVPPPVVELGPDTVLCSGDFLLLDAGDPGNTFLWNTGSRSRTLGVLSSGFYSVEVDNGYCVVKDSIQVHYNPLPERMRKHMYAMCLDEGDRSVALDAGNPGSTYRWSSGQHTQVINVASYGTFSVEITNGFGCSLVDSATVTESCKPTLFIPNAFTPDGDGTNDTWGPIGNDIVEYQVEVFDRWGGVVFHAGSKDVTWDGRMNGVPVKNDVYIYRAVFKLQEDGIAGTERSVMGQVQVVR